jgi:putative membrane protein
MSFLELPPLGPEPIGQFLAFALPDVPLLPFVATLLAVSYITGWVRLRLKGRRWPMWRGALFLAGCLLVFLTTATGVDRYGTELFSVFMFQQLTLMMAIPPLLVLGSPGTLLLRSVPRSGPGSLIGGIAIWGLRSRVTRLLLHPGFMIPLFLFTFYGIYLSPLGSTVLSAPAGHVWLELAFLAAGVLFTIPLISADPLPVRQSHLGRMLDLFAEMPLHAFFGVIVMMAVTPLVPYFGARDNALGVDPVADQQIAGALAWSYGELPTLLIALVLLARWYADDTRRSKARDVRVDRDGDPELTDYNEYLLRLQERDTRTHSIGDQRRPQPEKGGADAAQ